MDNSLCFTNELVNKIAKNVGFTTSRRSGLNNNPKRNIVDQTDNDHRLGVLERGNSAWTCTLSLPTFIRPPTLDGQVCGVPKQIENRRRAREGPEHSVCVGTLLLGGTRRRGGGHVVRRRQSSLFYAVIGGSTGCDRVTGKDGKNG